MILAAGRGERMRPLTDTTPKPMLQVHGKPLLQWTLEALVRAGVRDAVINTAWLGGQIARQYGKYFDLEPSSNGIASLSNEERIHIQYSNEEADFGSALETAGGIARAIAWLGDVFWLQAGDVFAPDFAFCQDAVEAFAASDKLAHIWLVPNPEHKPDGDFGWTPLATSATEGGPAECSNATGLALDLPAADPRPRLTYSTIGLYRSALFAPPWCDIPAGNPHGVKAPLGPLLRAAMAQQKVSAEMYWGRWADVGTPQRLQQLHAAWLQPSA